MDHSDNIFAGGSLEPVTIELWTIGLICCLQVASPVGFTLVRDLLPQVTEEIKADVSGQYGILRKSMEFSGQVIPLFLSKDKCRLRDGIHRIAIANDLGWLTMTVSTTRMVYSSWDESDDGREYHRRWEERVRGGSEKCPEK